MNLFLEHQRIRQCTLGLAGPTSYIIIYLGSGGMGMVGIGRFWGHTHGTWRSLLEVREWLGSHM